MNIDILYYILYIVVKFTKIEKYVRLNSGDRVIAKMEGNS